MPYIEERDRPEIDDALSEVVFTKESATGELNYAITTLALLFLKAHGKSYTNISKVCGVIGDVKDEIKRRLLGPYEDKKIEENGDLPLFRELIDG